MISDEQLVLLPLWYVVFLLSLTCHEAAHALAAYRGGDPTAYLGGQVSLNPVPHMQRELFGTVLVPLLTFFMSPHGWMMGWASAPYDPSWEERHPRRAALMAAAGPAANLLLALLGFAVLKLGLLSGVWLPLEEIRYDRLVAPAGEGATWWEGLGRFASILFSLNLILFLFNLLPIPPLDGASVLAGFLEPARKLRELLRANVFSLLIGLLVAWRLFDVVFAPIYIPILRLLYGWN